MTKLSWTQSLFAFTRKPVLAVFLFGIAQGFPLTLLLATLTLWLSRVGIEERNVGLFALTLAPYAWKFAWAPLIDRVPLPLISRWIGQRRAWLFLTQALLFALLIAIGFVDPRQDLLLLGTLVLATAVASASQDIVIDAYRIEILEVEAQGYGAAMINFGYRTGNLIAGIGTVSLAGIYGWGPAYQITAFAILFGTAAALWVGEPKRHDSESADAAEQKAEDQLARQNVARPFARAMAWVYATIIAPFAEFLRRPNALLILLFVVLYKWGDAMGQVMLAPLIVDLGFSNADYIWANKTVGFIALLIGTFLGGTVMQALGMFRALMATGILMMVTNLLFAWLALLGDNVYALALAVGFENFASGMGLAVFVAYLSALCNLAYTATHYALLSAFALTARSFMSAPSGYLVEGLGYPLFYLFTTIAAIPGLLLLWYLWAKGLRTAAPQAAITPK